MQKDHLKPVNEFIFRSVNCRFVSIFFLFIYDQNITTLYCLQKRFRSHLGNICRPEVSIGKASRKNSGGSPGSSPVRMDMLMAGGRGGEAATKPIFCTSRDGSMLPCRMDGSNRYSNIVANSTKPSMTSRLRKKFISDKCWI